MRSVCVATLLIGQACLAQLAPKPLSKEAESARDFAFEKVKLGTKLKEVLDKYPFAEVQKEDTETKLGTKAFR